MIGYITLGSNDIERSGRFYDALLSELRMQRLMETDRFIAWGRPGAGAFLCVITPYDGKPATVGNGVMVALQVDSEAEVDALHAKALSLGAPDEGAPGPRGEGGEDFYAGYFRDPDGNKLNAFKMT